MEPFIRMSRRSGDDPDLATKPLYLAILPFRYIHVYLQPGGTRARQWRRAARQLVPGRPIRRSPEVALAPMRPTRSAAEPRLKTPLVIAAAGAGFEHREPCCACGRRRTAAMIKPDLSFANNQARRGIRALARENTRRNVNGREEFHLSHSPLHNSGPQHAGGRCRAAP
jgi:hypothetical protein